MTVSHSTSYQLMNGFHVFMKFKTSPMYCCVFLLVLNCLFSQITDKQLSVFAAVVVRRIFALGLELIIPLSCHTRSPRVLTIVQAIKHRIASICRPHPCGLVFSRNNGRANSLTAEPSSLDQARHLLLWALRDCKNQEMLHVYYHSA